MKIILKYLKLSFFLLFFTFTSPLFSDPSWEIQTVDSGGDVGQYTSLRLDANDYPHIAYQVNSNPDQLKIAVYNGTDWEYQIVDSGLGIDGVWSWDEYLAWDGNYHHISYYNDATEDLQYAEGSPEPSSFLIFLSFLLFILHLFKKFLKI